MKHEIDIWQAIHEMRKLSSEKKEFAMVFMSYDESRQKSNGVIRVDRARLRPATSVDQNRNAEYMLNFLDIEQNLPRQCWQICLMEFNGLKINAQ
jgi:hypothetical protein